MAVSLQFCASRQKRLPALTNFGKPLRRFQTVSGPSSGERQMPENRATFPLSTRPSPLNTPTSPSSRCSPARVDITFHFFHISNDFDASPGGMLRRRGELIWLSSAIMSQRAFTANSKAGLPSSTTYPSK